MLVIGDISIQSVNKKADIRNVEIIYSNTNEKQYTKTVLDIQGIGSRIGVGSELFIANKKTNVILHDASSFPALKEVIRLSSATGLFFKIATPSINYVFDRAKIYNINRNFQEWERRVKSFSFLDRKYIQPYRDIRDDNTLRVINCRSLSLGSFIRSDSNIFNSPYKYKVFDKYTRRSLLEIVTTKELNASNLKKIIFIESGLLLPTQWKNLNNEEKIEAVMERLYIDVINEFIIPYLEDFKCSPNNLDVFENFKNCIMYMGSQKTEEWFYRFAVKNYEELLLRYNTGFKKAFINAINWKTIRKI
jgi:hypothetical protein